MQINQDSIEQIDEKWKGKQVFIGEQSDGHRRKVVKKECQKCEEEFYVPISELKRGRGKYCSLSCIQRKSIPNMSGQNNPNYVDGNSSTVKNWYEKKKKESECSNNECDESRAEALVFHHRDDEEKEEAVSEMVRMNRPIEEIVEEAKKCDILCRNCHAVLHNS